MANSVAKFSVVLGADSAALTSGLGGAAAAVAGFSKGVIGALTAIPAAALDAGLSFVSLTKDLLGLQTGMQALQVGIDFERQMSIVGAMTGATERQFHDLREEARRLGRDTEFTASQAAEAMSQLATHGFAVSDILEATNAVVKLASVLKVDIPQAAIIASDAMGGFGMHANDIQRVSDVIASMLTGASTGGADAIQDAFKYVAATGHAAGKSIEEVSATLMVLNNAGIKGSEAGSAVARFLMKMAKQTPAAQEALDKLGLTFEDRNGDFRHTADIVDDLQKKLTGLGKAKKLELIGKIFDVRAGRAAMILASLEGGGDKIRKFESRLMNAGGLSSKIAGKQLANVWGAIKIAQSSWEGFIETVYASGQGKLAAGINNATTLFNDMRNQAAKFLPQIIHQFNAPSLQGMGDGIFEGLRKAIPQLAGSLPRVAADLGRIAEMAGGFGEKFFKGGQVVEAVAITITSAMEGVARGLRMAFEMFDSNGDNARGKALEWLANIAFAFKEAPEYVTLGVLKMRHKMSELSDGFVNTAKYMLEIGEWMFKGLGELATRWGDNFTAMLKEIGNAVMKFMKDPSAGWQYTPAAYTPYEGAFGDAPQPKPIVTTQTAGYVKVIADLEKRIKTDRAKFITDFIDQIFKKPEKQGFQFMKWDVRDFFPKVFGIDLRDLFPKLWTAGAPVPPMGQQGDGKTPDKGPSAAILGTLEAAQAELKFWREEQGKSAEAQALAEAKRQSKLQQLILKELEESNNPTRFDLIF